MGWLRGVDLNHRPLGYEANWVGNFNNLQDAGGARSHCKERAELANGQAKDSQASLIRYLVEQRLMKLLAAVMSCSSGNPRSPDKMRRRVCTLFSREDKSFESFDPLFDRFLR